MSILRSGQIDAPMTDFHWRTIGANAGCANDGGALRKNQWRNGCANGFFPSARQ
jgi:hypothetical protein